MLGVCFGKLAKKICDIVQALQVLVNTDTETFKCVDYFFCKHKFKITKHYFMSHCGTTFKNAILQNSFVYGSILFIGFFLHRKL